LRLPAPIRLSLCSCCLIVSSLFACFEAVTPCERGRGFPHHPTARGGSIVKEH